MRSQNPDVNIFHYGSGDGLRDFVAAGGHTQDLVKEDLDKGKLAPTFLMTCFLAERLIKEIKGDEHMIFDGFPRTRRQARILDDALHFYRRENPVVVNIDLDAEESIARLRDRGRGDDLSEESLRKKMEWYDRQVLPMLGWYKEKPYYRVLDIDGSGSMESIAEDIAGKLNL